MPIRALSLFLVTSRGYEFHFARDVCEIYFRNKLVGMGYLIHGLYYVDNMSNNTEPPNVVNILLIKNTSNSKYL